MSLRAFSPSRRALVFHSRRALVLESEILDANPIRFGNPGFESDSNPRSWIRIRFDPGGLDLNPIRTMARIASIYNNFACFSTLPAGTGVRIRDPGCESDSHPRSWMRIRFESEILDLNPIRLWDSGFAFDSAHGQNSKDFQ